jgi:hypothetical protein
MKDGSGILSFLDEPPGENSSNLKRRSENDDGYGGLSTWGFFCVDIGSTRRIGRDGEPVCDGVSWFTGFLYFVLYFDP